MSTARRRVIRGPRQHEAKIHEPRLGKMTAAEAWSCLYPRYHEVYVQLFTEGKHVVTVSVRVPR